MSEHKTENQFQNNTKKNAAYLVQSYYDQNDELVSRDKFSICDGHLDNIESLSCDELKHVLVRHGIWPQYTRRIKNLEKVEREFWKNYEQEVDLAKKNRTLEDIANLQSVISNC
ncbi:MAG: hypothetical protein OPY07_03250 [Nitrosopumilus sp.]|nr:hypothetical protein [Nitrosopumilus sp.]